MPRLDRRYVWDHEREVVRPLAKGEDADAILAAEGGPDLLFFEPREASSAFIGGHNYLRRYGQDQILGFSIRVPDALRAILDRVYVEADRAVEKARRRERARRTSVSHEETQEAEVQCDATGESCRYTGAGVG